MASVHSLTIPPTREAVTAEWLTHTLGLHYPGVEVTAARVDEFMGHKPNKARVHLHYNQAGKAAGLPATMIVKGSFPGYASKGAIVDFSNVAEVVSYRDALLELDVNCPHAYVAALEPEHGASGIMLLEDLAPKQPVYFSAAGYPALPAGARLCRVDGQPACADLGQRQIPPRWSLGAGLTPGAEWRALVPELF
jgi:hypothetical protein